jgi:membrane protein implicated in regulation of membrane protease activity
MTDRTIELDQQRSPAPQKQTEIRRLLAKVAATERVLRHRKKELERRLAACPEVNSHNVTGKVRYRDDLWRFSCETPDAPHVYSD